MKKLTALLLSAGILFSMSACGGSKVSDEALDAFEAAIQNIADMKSADVTMDIDMTQDKENVSMSLEGSYNLETSEPQLALSLDMSSQGQKVDDFMNFYFKKDTMYMNMMEMQKVKKTMKDEMSSIPNISIDKDTLKIPKDDLKKYLKEASLKDDTLTLVFDADKVNEEIQKNASKAEAVAGNAKDAKIKAFKMVSKLENKQLRKADIDMSMTQPVDDKEVSMDMKMAIEFKNVGKNQQIKFPADLDTYVESVD